jgi:hypothetical protein
VAAGVLYLVWARANRRAFHLPGGDGTVIMAAGIWAAALLVWRLFDKPGAKQHEEGLTIGVEWGIFVALLAAGALAAAGARVRAAHRPEPPNPVADEDGWSAAAPRQPRPDRRPRDAGAVTEVLRDRPAWQGEPPSRPPVTDPADADTRVDPAEADTRADPAEADTRADRDDPPPDRLF